MMKVVNQPHHHLPTFENRETMHKKILLVDDDDDDDNIRFLAEMSLEDDWQVLTACSGREALITAARDRPDVILLDMMMPEMTGAETFLHLRAMNETKSTPVIFITAKVQEKEVANYMALGVTGVSSNLLIQLVCLPKLLR
jgi:CheY-like chemotaxis protein